MNVLGCDARDKHKFDIALKYCKAKLTDFRTEERRKVGSITLICQLHYIC